MIDIPEDQLRNLERMADNLIRSNPELYAPKVPEAAVNILESNISYLQQNLASELPAIRLASQAREVTEEVLSVDSALWRMIGGVALKANDPNYSAVRAAICALPHNDPQDPEMALEFLIIFSKAAGFSMESIIRAITSAFSIVTVA